MPPVGRANYLSQRLNNDITQLIPFQKKLVNLLSNSHAFVNFVSLTLIIHGNQGGLMQQEASRLQEVQQNEGLVASAASSPQRSRKGIPQTGGFKETVPPVNNLPKNFARQPDRTEQKKGKYPSL